MQKLADPPYLEWEFTEEQIVPEGKLWSLNKNKKHKIKKALPMGVA